MAALRWGRHRSGARPATTGEAPDRRECHRECHRECRRASVAWSFVALGTASVFAGCCVFWAAAVAALMLGWGIGAVGMLLAVALMIGGLVALGETWR